MTDSITPYRSRELEALEADNEELRAQIGALIEQRFLREELSDTGDELPPFNPKSCRMCGDRCVERKFVRLGWWWSKRREAMKRHCYTCDATYYEKTLEASKVKL